jgi:hypothetical protein
MVLEKDGEDYLDRWCEKGRNITCSQEGEEYPTHNKGNEVPWIGHVLRRNCILKHVMQGKIKGRSEVTGRRERRRKQLWMALRNREDTGN